MFIKIICTILMLFIISISASHPCYSASLVRLPTEDQLEILCVPVRLTTDGDIHWFYFKHIKQFNQHGLSIVYGKKLTKVNFIEKEKIINFDEALKRFKEIKKANE